MTGWALNHLCKANEKQLWNIYNRLPTPTSKSAQEQRELKRQFMKLRTELNATSSQDEFAKWAKLRRQHDKVLEQLEKSSKVPICPTELFPQHAY
jgi:hypothetical protein